MADTPSPTKRYRPLLLALAIVLAAAAALYSGVWMYYSNQPGAPVEVGMDTEQVAAGLLVKSVYPNSPAQGAGLRVGDIILAINGESADASHNGIRLVDAIWMRSHPGETVHLTLQRRGVAAPFAISPLFRHPRDAGDTPARRRAIAVLMVYPVVFLVVGLAVLFLRLQDKNAWLLALLFACFTGIAPAEFSLAPVRVQDFTGVYIALTGALLTPLFYFFFAVFPTSSPIDRRLPWLKWLLLVVSASLRLGNVRQGSNVALPFLEHLFGHHAVGLARLTIGYGTVLLGIASLVLNLLHASSVEERRKLKVMLWGTVVGLTPALLVGLPYDLIMQRPPFWMVFTQAVFLFVFPLSFAYAVVKHRVMDIPVLLRRSARYLLVERGFAILILLISIGITLWFGQAFSRLFSAGTMAAIPIGATFGVLVISGALQVHRQVRTRLDRAFFRSAYDAQQVLENLAATALTVTDRHALAELLHRHIHEALHPMPLVVYLLSGEGWLRAYAGHPPDAELTLRSSEPRLAYLARKGEPVDVNVEMLRDTPLEQLHAECLVPIGAPSEGQLQGLTVLGPRLSEETYSARDKRLLASVASQAGIAMRSISLAEKMAERMEAERRSEQEMQIARQVQSRLLPQEAPKLATLDCEGKCIQTRAVGGDYYDFLDFGSGKLGMVLADISGKGISAALLMANLQANLRGQYALALEDLPRLLRSVNYLFYKNTETNNYATMFFSIYEDESRTLRYVNCGHNPPVLLRADGAVERLEATATVLGLFEQWDCAVAERQLGDGDILLIYTDGISEAAPAEDAEEFGEDRLIAVMKSAQCESAGEMLDRVVAEVQRFSHGEQADDMTLIVARCR